MYNEHDYTQNNRENQRNNTHENPVIETSSLDVYDYYNRLYTQSPQPPPSQPMIQQQPPVRRKKKSGRAGFAAILIIVCMIGSGIAGFAGTYFANSLNEPPAYEERVPAISGKPIPAANNDPNTMTTPALPPVIHQPASTSGSDTDASEQMSIADVVTSVKHAVVEIQTERVSTGGFMREFVSTGAGSGVIISEDGYIITNDHVISGAQSIKVRLSNEQEYAARLIGSDRRTDLAVLKIEADNLQPATMGHSSSLQVGQIAVAIGNPLGELGGTVTSGIVSALDRELTIDGETMSLLQTDAAVNPGNSGGGLFDLHGKLVGIVNAKSSGSEIEGLGFAIPIDTAKIVVEQLIEYGYVRGRIDPGLTLVDIQDPFTAMSYRVNYLGLYISRSISPDFQSGDRIIAVDNLPISSLAEWNQKMKEYSVGDVVNITVARGESSPTIPLTLAEMTIQRMSSPM